MVHSGLHKYRRGAAENHIRNADDRGYQQSPWLASEPAEIEGCLLQYRHVLDAAIIARDSQDGNGELLRAYTAVAPGLPRCDCNKYKDQPLRLRGCTTESIQTARRWRGVLEMVDASPCDASGKILRKVLRQ